MAKLYRDFNLNFEPNPLTRDIAVVSGTAAVEQSIRNIILTGQYERPFQPLLHGSVHELLFEPSSPVTLAAVTTQIEQTLRDNEPRLEELQVRVEDRPEQNALIIQVYYTVRATTQTQVTEILLERTG